MTGSVRPQREEFVSPRLLILTACFVWGIAMGFLLNFYRQPESGNEDAPAQSQGLTVAQIGSTGEQPEIDRRLEGTPTIAAIEPTAAPAPGERLSLENTIVPLPSVSLSTEGGLTGRLAALPRAEPRSLRPPPPPASSMPLIPDLDP